jgi:hypothetical protein
MGPSEEAAERIKRRAFELWEEHGRPEGYESEFWLQAEREQEEEGSRRGVTANAVSHTSGSGSDGPR